MIPYHFLVSLPFFHVKESKLDLKAKRLLFMKLSIGACETISSLVPIFKKRKNRFEQRYNF